MPEEDLHLSDHMRLQAHECGGLPPLFADGAHRQLAMCNSGSKLPHSKALRADPIRVRAGEKFMNHPG